MTAIALKPTLASQIKRQIFGIPHRRHRAKRIETARSNIIDRLTKPSKRLHTPLPIQTATLWRLINTAIVTGDLDINTLTDRPSQLKHGFLYLSHERVTGLLDDISLPLADITPTEFYAIMLQLGGKRYAITSEQSIDTTGRGETRISYQLPIATLINLNHVKAQLKEVA